MVLCLILTVIATFNGKIFSWNCLRQSHRCTPWENEHIKSIKAMAIFMCLAIASEMICLLWNLITFCACCLKKYIIHPLMLFSFITTALLLVPVVLYTTSHQKSLDYYYQHRNTELGYSFWLLVGALVLAGVDTAVASLTVCLGSRGF
ncbi:hypothetical protein DICVIV_06734 [Dictyocaulus viviparus]|uniref:Uncharacterized protein n=1 Tax=Dictyocaulus viviparus TaxID=29172 RepID=A0A0D8XTS9_DICVI|nr:hypothetical protein DICVIV_06734 [Dictyocaulus viviparus]